MNLYKNSLNEILHWGEETSTEEEEETELNNLPKGYPWKT